MPGGEARQGESPKAAAIRILADQCRLEASDMFPIHRGKGDVWTWTSTYEARQTTDEPGPADGLEVAWVGMHEILCGQRGLYARDVFNKMGWMNRPALRVDKLYRLSAAALNNRSGREGAELEGVDLVVDEITFLIDIDKKSALTEILKSLDCEKLHANILDVFVSMVEEIPDLEGRDDFVTRAKARIALVDSTRMKMRLVVNGRTVSDDVRGDAAKIYKQRAAEFGRMAKDGTLGAWMEKRRGLVMKSVADRKARQAKRGDVDVAPDPSEPEATRNKPSLGKFRYD